MFSIKCMCQDRALPRLRTVLTELEKAAPKDDQEKTCTIMGLPQMIATVLLWGVCLNSTGPASEYIKQYTKKGAGGWSTEESAGAQDSEGYLSLQSLPYKTEVHNSHLVD